ncbi:MarR family winged helix-turn-helix transcriptional regulator [Solibacillus daqui]|uniref:MarR family winged helix-turn-helix transcriptional regulator n=1 Tax=Solibacillus daqui TaxID=2912187 RepID=UPI00236551A8|nr:MarR family transcriptional regulator [Solibacillus daqui]
MSQYDLQLKAFTVLNRAANASQEVTKKHALASNLNLTEFAVLEFLYHKGEQPIQIIGKKVLIASSSITYVVDKLEQKGFVHRKSCANDRRVTYAELTDLGEQQIAEIFPTHEQKISEIFEVLSNEEMETLIILLKRIGHHASSI